MTVFKRGLLWGLTMSGIGLFVLLAVFPVFNHWLWVAAAIIVGLSLTSGIVMQARASTVLCACGQRFLALSKFSRCPDCGQICLHRGKT